ncbi:hypothetical protein [Nonomuraea sp. NPDC049709]|uniref:hypothetical protein n=1 Tax=Nonomuraea sp. NPDC049709 TaxID=3154736 RepID=UPI00341AE6F5
MRRAAMVALTLLPMTGLLMTGCAPPERPYRPQEGATTAPSPSGTTSASRSETGSETGNEPARTPGPETISIGGGKLRVDIDWPAGRDPLIDLMADYYVASRKALVSGSDRYLKGLDLELTGVREAYDWVHGYTEKEKTVKGATRLYDLRVAAVMDKGAQVNACVDETGARVVSTRTGKAVAPQPLWVRAPYLQVLLAHRGDDGVWRIRGFRYDLKGCT